MEALSPAPYSHIYRELRNPYTFCIKVVQYAEQHGISGAGSAKRFAPFTKLQQDVKDFDDILAYWPQMRQMGLPRSS